MASQIPRGWQGELLALGIYPDVSLKRARERRDELRRELANGIDPNVKRKVEKAATTDSFEVVASAQSIGCFRPAS